MMRTTMTIDDDLLLRLKKRAADAGVSVSTLLNRTLREALSGGPSGPELPPFRMVTFGRGLPMHDHSPEELARSFEEEDIRTIRGF